MGPWARFKAPDSREMFLSEAKAAESAQSSLVPVKSTYLLTPYTGRYFADVVDADFFGSFILLIPLFELTPLHEESFPSLLLSHLFVRGSKTTTTLYQKNGLSNPPRRNPPPHPRQNKRSLRKLHRINLSHKHILLFLPCLPRLKRHIPRPLLALPNRLHRSLCLHA